MDRAYDNWMIDDILRTLLTLGPGGLVAAVMTYLWSQERSERRETQSQLNELGRRSIEADFTVAKSLDGLTSAMNTVMGSMPNARR